MTFEQVLYEFIELRSYERIFGMSVGALSIVLGFALFKSGIETPQSAIAKIGSYEFKFLKVAPGVFFSLFGVLLTGYITYEHPTLESIKTSINHDANKSPKNGQDHVVDHIVAGFSDVMYDELMKSAASINTAREAINNMPKEASEGITMMDPESSYGQLVRAVNLLHIEHNGKIFNSLPVEVFTACAGKGHMPKEYTKDVCVRIDELKNVKLK
jgi:hypothetical protein